MESSKHQKNERTDRIGRAGKAGRAGEIGDPRELRELEELEEPCPQSVLLPEFAISGDLEPDVLTFGFGRRMCVGQPLARLTKKIYSIG